MKVCIDQEERRKFIIPSNFQHDSKMLDLLHRALKKMEIPDFKPQGELFDPRPNKGVVLIKKEYVIFSLFHLSDPAGRYWLGMYDRAGIKEFEVLASAMKEVRDTPWG